MTVYTIKAKESSVCPICGGRFCVIGVRRRQMIESCGTLEILIIRRLRCTVEICRKIHHELPDCLYPYKQHCAETIENIIDGKLDAVPCSTDEARKIGYWWRTIYPYFLQVLLTLNTKYGTCFDHSTSPRDVVRAVVNSHSWVHTHSLVTPACRVATIMPKPKRTEFEQRTGA